MIVFLVAMLWDSHCSFAFIYNMNVMHYYYIILQNAILELFSVS